MELLMKINKISLLLIILLILVSFIGCNHDIDTPSLDKEESSKSSIVTTESTSNDNNIEDYSLANHFSEGLAWIKYGKSPIYMACIDKKGNLIFQYDADECNSPTKFSNGYSYFYGGARNTKIYVVNKNGDICSSYNRVYEEKYDRTTTTYGDQSNYAVAYGNGYTVVQVHYSDFDSAHYEYDIYNPDGTILYTYKTEVDTAVSVRYCECGVFSFEADKTYFYFTNSEKWIQYDYDKDIEFYNDLVLIDKSTILDSKGNIIEIDLSEIKNLYNKENISKIYGNSVISFGQTKYDVEKDKIYYALTSYNISEKKMYYCKDNSIIDKIDWENFKSLNNFNNDCFAVPLVGADGIDYVAVLDYELNVLIEPIPYSSYEVHSNGICTIQNSGIISFYDINGNIVSSLTDKIRSFETTNPNTNIVEYKYEDDFFIFGNFNSSSDDKNNFAAFDKDGNLLFDTIDITNVVTKELD